jgi:gliding motility-associated-like protein
VDDGNGCLDRDTAVLTVYPNPTVDLRDTVVCDVINIILDAGSGFTYLWDDNSTNQTLSVSAPGTYSVTVTTANTCTASDNATVSLAASSSPLIASAADTSICTGESVQLSVTGGTGYTWQPSATLDNSNIPNPVATPAGNTEYIVSALDPVSGCAQADTVAISVRPALSGTVTRDTFLCAGSSVQLNAADGTSYNWSPAAGLSCADCPDPIASPAQTTDYSVTISASGYCNEDTLHIIVTVYDRPNPGLDSLITISYGSEVTFTPNGGMDDYDWTATDGWTCEGCPNPTVSPHGTTIYTLQVTDSNGCKAVALGTVEVLSECEGKFLIPTAFSPNGDGYNDEFRILHPGDLRLVDFKVFNRWGEIVFQTTDASQGWDGFYKGDIQDLAVYAWYAQMTCGNEVKTLVGNVTLIH